jgi:hypothetical protein
MRNINTVYNGPTLVLSCVFFLLTACCFLPLVVHAWPRENVHLGATFLLIPAGARAAGCGYAYTARINPCLSNYYNAAGLAFCKRPGITAEHLGYLTGLYDDMHDIYLAGAFSKDASAWGFNGSFLNLGQNIRFFLIC